MGRKLIQHGRSSLTVSLPKKWVNENSLKKGDEIEVEDFQGNILISTRRHYEHRKIDIDIAGAAPMIRKIMGATFKAGYDEVDIGFHSHEELKAVQNLVREQFTGFEIVRQTKDSMVVRNLSQTSFEEFNNVLRRFFFVLNHMASEVHSAMEKNDFKWLKNTALMKTESDKFADYCRRAINMGFDSEFKRTAPLYTIIEQLEKVADRYRDLCCYVSEKKIRASKRTKSFLQEVVEFQKQFYDLFYRFDLKRMAEFGKRKESLQEKSYELVEHCSKKEIRIILLFDRIVNLVFDLNGPLMAVHI